MIRWLLFALGRRKRPSERKKKNNRKKKAKTLCNYLALVILWRLGNFFSGGGLV